MLDNVVMNVKCVNCRKVYEIKVPADQYLNWQHGLNAYDAFPQLSRNEVELISGGTCNDCVDNMIDDFVMEVD